MAGGTAVARSSRSTSPAPAGAKGAAKGSKASSSRRKKAPSSERDPKAQGRPHRGLTVAGGIVWAVALLGAAAVGPVAVAAVTIPVGFVAAVSGVRALDKGKRQKARPGGASVFAAGAVAVVLPVAAVGGPVAALSVGAALVVAVGAVLYLRNPRLAGPVMLAVFVPATATASLVAASEQTSNLGLTLAAGVCLYDLACWVNGSGRGLGGPVGIGAGVMTVGVLAVFVAAVFVPPFTGARPWVMLGMLAVLAPVGALVGGRIGGSKGVSGLPAVRRLDSLIVAGPAWVIATALILHR